MNRKSTCVLAFAAAALGLSPGGMKSSANAMSRPPSAATCAMTESPTQAHAKNADYTVRKDGNIIHLNITDRHSPIRQTTIAWSFNTRGKVESVTQTETWKASPDSAETMTRTLAGDPALVVAHAQFGYGLAFDQYFRDDIRRAERAFGCKILLRDAG